MIGNTFGMVGLSVQQTMAARDAQRESASAQNLARQVQYQARILEANLAKALMINEALWEIIRDKLKLGEDDLNNKLYEIDMRDGLLDGKNQRRVSECPNCHRCVSPRHPACIYCGQIMDDSVFSIS